MIKLKNVKTLGDFTEVSVKDYIALLLSQKIIKKGDSFNINLIDMLGLILVELKKINEKGRSKN